MDMGGRLRFRWWDKRIRVYSHV